MHLFIRIRIIILILLLLCACSAKQNNQSNTYKQPLQLSTHDKDDVIEEQIGKDNAMESQEEEKPGEKEQIPVTPEKLRIEQQDQREINSMEEDSLSPATVSNHLPFEGFVERWNAVTEEQMSQLFIKNLEKTQNDDGVAIYQTQLNSKINLSVSIANNNVQSLEINSIGKSRDNIYTMLSGWTQMINILNSEMAMDVDTIFNQLGIKPNGDLTHLKATSFTHLDLHYDLSITEMGYKLKVAYEKTQ